VRVGFEHLGFTSFSATPVAPNSVAACGCAGHARLSAADGRI
jgi:hypothetical protein